MIVRCLAWLALFVAATAPGAAQTPPPAAPVEKLPASAFAKLPFIEQARLSPNGLYMAGLLGIGGEQRLAIMPVVGDRSGGTMVAIPDKAQVSSVNWVNDDHVIVGLRLLLPVEGQDWYVSRYWSMDRKTGNITRILWNQSGQGANLLWLPSDGSTEVLIAAQGSIYLHDKEFWPSVFRVDVTNGKARVEEPGRTNVYSWGADSAGRVRYGVTYIDTSTRSRLLYRGESGGTWRSIGSAVLRDDEELAYPLEFISGTDNALIIADNADGNSVLAEQNMVSGEQQRIVFAPAKGSVTDIWSTRDGTRLLGVYTSEGGGRAQWIDPVLAGYQTQLDAASPKSNVEIVSMSADQTKMLVRISTPDNPGLLFYFDGAKGELARLAAYNDVIGGKRLSRAKMIQYQARDGLMIEAVLTLPRGREAKALPFIVMPHGGPWGHDELTYDYLAQYLAEQGYGVIQPNFRGSTGYGQDFVDKGLGQIGLAMQDDKNDALAWAVREGIADPKRTCIVGASYGGYAAMWGAARDPDLYRCAISIAGVSNLRKEVSDFGGTTRENLYRTQWGRMSNDFAAVSPINFVERIKVPILLIHGKKDVTVDHGQSERMAVAMRRAGKTHEFVSLPLADHYFTREADRLALLEAMGTFLRTHNPPD